MEDQPVVAAVIALELAQCHISITTARSGEQALALARAQRFDLILLDQMMPAPDGLEICRRLKMDPGLRDIPVIFFTAYADPAAEREAIHLGAADFLQKEIHSPRLAARILAEVELARERTKHAPLKPPHKLNEGTHPLPSKHC